MGKGNKTNVLPIKSVNQQEIGIHVSAIEKHSTAIEIGE